MRPYEVMVIFNAELEDQAVRDAVNGSVELIKGMGAEPGYIDFWGKRRLAYEINHKTEGYYVVMQAMSEPAAMAELHRTLSLSDDVIRHKVLRIPAEVYGPPKARQTADAAAKE